jgi:hypothetical protein
MRLLFSCRCISAFAHSNGKFSQEERKCEKERKSSFLAFLIAFGGGRSALRFLSFVVLLENVKLDFGAFSVNR